MFKVFLFILITVFLYSQDKPSIKVEDGYLIIRLKLDEIDFIALEKIIEKTKSGDAYQKRKKLRAKQENIKEVLDIIEIYEILLRRDKKNLSKSMQVAKSRLILMKQVYARKRKAYYKANIRYTFDNISRIDDTDIHYSFGKISRIGDIDIHYSFDKISRIDDINIHYSFGELSRIGNYNINY